MVWMLLSIYLAVFAPAVLWWLFVPLGTVLLLGALVAVPMLIVENFFASREERRAPRRQRRAAKKMGAIYYYSPAEQRELVIEDEQRKFLFEDEQRKLVFEALDEGYLQASRRARACLTRRQRRAEMTAIHARAAEQRRQWIAEGYLIGPMWCRRLLQLRRWRQARPAN